MRIDHETSPAIALSIIRAQAFYGGELHDDDGLNAIPNGVFGLDVEIFQARHTGVKLIFDWSGPIISTGLPLDFQPDNIYDLLPHRYFVPHGTTKHLKLVHVHLRTGYSWEEAYSPKPALPGFSLSPKKWTDWIKAQNIDWEQTQLKTIQDKITAINTSNGLPIVVNACRQSPHWR